MVAKNYSHFGKIVQLNTAYCLRKNLFPHFHVKSNLSWHFFESEKLCDFVYVQAVYSKSTRFLRNLVFRYNLNFSKVEILAIDLQLAQLDIELLTFDTRFESLRVLI